MVRSSISRSSAATDVLVLKPETGKSFLSNRRIALMGMAVVVATLCAWAWSVFSIAHVVDLSADSNLTKSGLYKRWLQGDVVVMIRHGERCDRSSNPCMNGGDGITRVGSEAALAVGAGLKKLGLNKAVMIASPTTRTQQTAERVSGHAVATQDWVNDCDSGFKDAVVAHKNRGENLILVTHSGCIDHFERKLGVPFNERSAAYAEAVFVQIDGTHRPRILGSMKAGQWADLNSEQLN